MRVSQAKALFQTLTKQYFANAEVTFTKQSRVAKPQIPLVTITPGNVKRSLFPVYEERDGTLTGHYLSRINIQIDLFTHGLPIIDEETGKTIAYENTAIDDMLSFADFLNSQYTIEWCHEHDVSILIEGDVQDLTGLVNDNNYEFRSQLVVLFFFTQKAVGHTGVLSEDSIQYPTGEIDSQTGEPIYSKEEPKQTESSTNANNHVESIVIPEFIQTSSGGGTNELAQQETGYFTEAEITEEEKNK